MTKELIHQENTILNVSTSNNRASNHMKQKLTTVKGKIDKSTITVGGINIPFSLIDRIDIIGLNKDLNTIYRLDLIDIYRTLIPNTNRIHFSSACGTFTKIEHIMGQKISQ